MFLDLDNISWQDFEDLTHQYFMLIGDNSKHGGVGPDGGKDLIITCKVKDSILEHTVKWVVQCKYYDRNVSPADLNDFNLPTLVQSQGAIGYLLIVRRSVTSGLSNLFEDLNRYDKLGHKYMYWSGSEFESKIRPYSILVEQFFPRFQNFIYTK